MGCSGRTDYPPLQLYWTGSTAQASWKLTAGKAKAGWRLVKTYRPSGSHVDGDTTIVKPPAALDALGIKDPYRVQVDALVGPLSNDSTPGGGTINSKLEPYGWSADAEQMDGDHVKEIQMGGKDVLANLWPLNASMNRGAGSTIAKAQVQLGADKLTVDLLKQVKLSAKDKGAGKFTFKISSVRPRP